MVHAGVRMFACSSHDGRIEPYALLLLFTGTDTYITTVSEKLLKETVDTYPEEML